MTSIVQRTRTLEAPIDAALLLTSHADPHEAHVGYPARRIGCASFPDLSATLTHMHTLRPAAQQQPTLPNTVKFCRHIAAYNTYISTASITA
jgi:hypothetical protein